MKIYAIGDLHLSRCSDKPMDVFGEHWKEHDLRIEKNWREVVTEEDIVLLPGDLSWAMKPEEAAADIGWLGELPGTKIIIRGNHDYWWSSLTRVRKMLPDSIIPLQHTSFDCGKAVITGTRGWITSGSEGFDEERDEKILKRELHRLDLALDSAAPLREDGKPLIVMLHYPPVLSGRSSEFSKRMTCSAVDLCIYGHIHNAPGFWPDGQDAEIDGVKYRLVSADYLDFKPMRIL
jgi:uncharacterized protein